MSDLQGLRTEFTRIVGQIEEATGRAGAGVDSALKDPLEVAVSEWCRFFGDSEDMASQARSVITDLAHRAIRQNDEAALVNDWAAVIASVFGWPGRRTEGDGTLAGDLLHWGRGKAEAGAAKLVAPVANAAKNVKAKLGGTAKSQGVWRITLMGEEYAVQPWQIVLLALVVVGVAALLLHRRSRGPQRSTVIDTPVTSAPPAPVAANGDRALVILVGASAAVLVESLKLATRLDEDSARRLQDAAEWFWYGRAAELPSVLHASLPATHDGSSMFWVKIRTMGRVPAIELARNLAGLRDALGQLGAARAEVGIGGPIPLAEATGFHRL
jgi:hypothetical protein